MTENTKPRSMPPAHGRDEELYAQIAAGDEIQVQTKRRSSLIMSIVIFYMRMTLEVDALKRDYQKLFRTIGWVWSGIMSVIYLCGLTMFTILLVSYMRFPDYVREQLEKNDILYDKMEIPGYIISRVKIINLHDKQDIYKIGELDISSTFADFLNKRIKNLSITGLNLTLSPDKQPEILTKFLFPKPALKGEKNIRVDSLKISDSKIIFKGKNYEIPISISLTGVYGNETNISTYISVNQPFLSVKGPLTVQGRGEQLTWDLNIQSGSITFPKRPKENLSGKIELKTKSNTLTKLSADLTLSYEKIRKDFELDINKKGKAFNGNLKLIWLDTTVPAKPEERAKISLGLSDLDLSSFGEMKTASPVKIDFSTTLSNMALKNIKGNLDGELICKFSDYCSYNLKKKSTLTVGSLKIQTPRGAWSSSSSSKISLEPRQDLLSFSILKGDGTLKMDVSNFAIRGKQQQEEKETSVSAKDLTAETTFNIWDKSISSAVSLSQFNYHSSDYEVLNATLNIENIFDSTKKIYLDSSHVLLKNHEYLRFPFTLHYLSENGLSSVFLTTKKNDINLSFRGYLDILSGDINGQFIIPKFKLSNLINNYKDAKSLPKGLENLSGEMAAYGNLIGNTRTNVNGPFYVALSDIGIKTKELTVNGINAALSMKSLFPMVTQPRQNIFIKNIESILPIDNIEMTLRLENRFAQLSSLTASIAGIPFKTEETLIPYKDITTLVYLKNTDNNISDIQRSLSIPNWEIDSDLYGSIFLPIEVKNLTLSIKNASVQLSDAHLKYTGVSQKKPWFLDNEKQFLMKSGNILIDANQDNPKDVNITFLMNILLGNNEKIKKSIRETIITKISDIVSFQDKTPNSIPKNIENQIQKIFQNIEIIKNK